MEIGCLPFSETGYFSKLITDYLSGAAALRSYYDQPPTLSGLEKQRDAKITHFSAAHRKLLQEVLTDQYKTLDHTQEVLQQIEALGQPNTTTVVTGHQLNLFSGPLYFLYKIVAVINLAEQLSKDKKRGKVVPVYWMATEDHDFEEINFFNIKGVKLQWTPPYKVSGAVGRCTTQGLEEVLPHLESLLGTGKNARYLLDLFESSYLEQPNLSAATRFFAHRLFGDKGLIIIDGDHPRLKRLLIPHIKKDLFEHTAFEKVKQTNLALSAEAPGYHIQVNPREINYFYLEGNIRERIVATAKGFEVQNSTLTFTFKEMEQLIEAHPERFSPNVIARPLYQEVILPNIAYIGGGGELAYWLELKSYFEAHKVLFPVLMLRNSALLLSEKQLKKWTKMGMTPSDLFLKRHPLINKKIRSISNIDLDLSELRKQLHQQFLSLYDLATQTDPSFLGAVQAQEVKQIKGINALEKRLLLAQKKKLQDQVTRLSQLHETLFPTQSLQERQQNFSEFYVAYGPQLLQELFNHLNPLKNGFSVLSL